MREFSMKQEETRLNENETLMVYPEFKERHRVFPAIFEQRQHKNILDSSAGIGYAAQRIRDGYSAKLICNEISPACFPDLKKLNLPIVSFDLDDSVSNFPFPDGSFDAVVSLVTIEHLLNVDHFIMEIKRVLSQGGFLYITTPNYAAPEYILNSVLRGRSYHDPLDESSRYEFYAHVRYFTYITLLEFVASFGFVLDTVYIAHPGGSERYQNLYKKSKIKAKIFHSLMTLRHRVLSPRWASEPILCFKKTDEPPQQKVRKVVF